MQDPNYGGEDHDLKRVLKTLGVAGYSDYNGNTVGVQEATNRRTLPRDNPHWEGIAEALQYKLDYDAGTVQPPPPPPPVTPEITIPGGSGITEGGSASFTISANPAPAGSITVNIGVSESGSFGASSHTCQPGKTGSNHSLTDTPLTITESNGVRTLRIPENGKYVCLDLPNPGGAGRAAWKDDVFVHSGATMLKGGVER